MFALPLLVTVSTSVVLQHQYENSRGSFTAALAAQLHFYLSTSSSLVWADSCFTDKWIPKAVNLQREIKPVRRYERVYFVKLHNLSVFPFLFCFVLLYLAIRFRMYHFLFQRKTYRIDHSTRTACIHRTTFGIGRNIKIMPFGENSKFLSFIFSLASIVKPTAGVNTKVFVRKTDLASDRISRWPWTNSSGRQNYIFFINLLFKALCPELQSWIISSTTVNR